MDAETWVGYWLGYVDGALPADASPGLCIGYQCGLSDAGHQETTHAQALRIIAWECHRLLAPA